MNHTQLLRTIGRASLVLGIALGLGTLSPPGAEAQSLDPKATEVLQAMSDYLEGLPAFSVNADVDFEVVARTGQKLQLSSYASLTMQRPNGFYIQRRGVFADAEIFFNGTTLTLFGKQLNAYAQRPVNGTIDDAIRVFESESGIPAPGADFMFADPYAVMSDGVTSSLYLGTAYVNGIEAHHLAFREAEVDWQIWVQTGDTPLPLKYVITTKWVTGAPQYELRMRDWNTNPQIASDRFTFTAPAGASQLDSLPASAIDSLSTLDEALQ